MGCDPENVEQDPPYSNDMLSLIIKDKEMGRCSIL
jgi:hypothetical protein